MKVHYSAASVIQMFVIQIPTKVVFQLALLVLFATSCPATIVLKARQISLMVVGAWRLIGKSSALGSEGPRFYPGGESQYFFNVSPPCGGHLF